MDGDIRSWRANARLEEQAAGPRRGVTPLAVLASLFLAWVVWIAIDLARQPSPKVAPEKIYVVLIRSDGNPLLDRFVRIDDSAYFDSATDCARARVAFGLPGECLEGAAIKRLLMSCRKIRLVEDENIWRCGLRTRLGL